MKKFKSQHLSKGLEVETDNSVEVAGVLKLAAVSGSDGQLYLFPPRVKKCNYSRSGSDGCEDPGITHVEPLPQTSYSDPPLAEFHREAEKVFEMILDQIEKALPEAKNRRKAALNKQLLKLETIIQKLENEVASALNPTMISFREHVSEAHHKGLILPIPGLPD